jgi:hypothetical protein
MKQYTVLKLIGLAILTMITLVIISVLEVTLYSYVINPGHDEAFYEAHAQLTAPYISGIFGFIVFFLVTRYWTKKGYHDVSRLAILFPLTYVLMDIVILFAAGIKWSDYILIFLLANAAKFLGSYLGYKLTKAKQAVSS